MSLPVTRLAGGLVTLIAAVACGDSAKDPVSDLGGGAPPAPDMSAAPPSSPTPGIEEEPSSAAPPVTSNGGDIGTPELGAMDPVQVPGAPSGELPSEPPEATPVERHGQLRVEGTRLVDETGAVVQLKGVSTMWLNWEDRYSTSRAGLEWMRDNWKISVVRAAMGIEPNGAYLTDPEPALAQLRQVVQNAIDVGVYVLIDWHAHNAIQNQAEAVAFFSQIAREFGAFPNVLYEPFNEPLNISWSNAIKPYHEAVLAAIRAEDPDNVAILGTRSWSQRVDEAALDPIDGTNLMYTVHFYACDHKNFQRGLAETAYAAGLPLFVTEWGATPADGGSAERVVCEADAQVWLDWLNERSISWAAWKLDGCRDSSCFFTSRNAPADGGWTDQWLNGHGRFVVERLTE